jgi:hypothetical protein
MGAECRQTAEKWQRGVTKEDKGDGETPSKLLVIPNEGEGPLRNARSCHFVEPWQSKNPSKRLLILKPGIGLAAKRRQKHKIREMHRFWNEL